MLNQKRPHDHYLAVSVSYKSDLWNLLEFIEYHRLVGVTHFFICNNDDNPARSSKVLQHYVEQNIVTNIHTAKKFQGDNNRQRAGHNLCLYKARNKVKWLALLDMDEFIFPIKHETVTDVLRGYEDCRAVMFNYCCFGSSNRRWRPDLQTEAYTRRAKTSWGWNRLCKAIGQVNQIPGVMHHHHFDHNMVDEDKKKCGWVKPYKGKVMRINHYMARSREDYKYKMARGNPLGERRNWKWFAWADRNEVYDDSMRRFTDRLKDALLERVDLLKMSRKQVSLL